MATATIVGGATVNLNLDAREAALAQMALTAAGERYTKGKVFTDLDDSAGKHTFQVYAIDGSEGETILMPLTGEVLVAEGTNDVSLVGHGVGAAGEVLIGNSGNDTINAGGGSGTIISGSGNDLIQLNTATFHGKSDYIVTGTGSDTVDMWGGKATIDNAVTATLNIYSHGNTVVGLNDLNVFIKGGSNLLDLTGDDHITIRGGTNTLTLSGNDTITFGKGNDTIIEHGTSTITSTAAGVLVESGTGTASMAAGSGSSTLIGGTGNDTLAAGSGTTSLIGGQSANTFYGGTGADTMVGGGTSNAFTFVDSSVAGGTHEIDNFIHGADKIDLINYNNFNFADDVKEVGGNAVITLDGGHTVITVEDTTLTKSDFHL
jgi:Ca2+-binding RTX toxin-like protein